MFLKKYNDETVDPEERTMLAEEPRSMAICAGGTSLVCQLEVELLRPELLDVMQNIRSSLQDPPTQFASDEEVSQR